MPVFVEGDLRISMNNVLDARKFDDQNHGLSHCMKAVDFVVELPHLYLFIEFKDPEHPSAIQQDRQAFLQSFYSGRTNDELVEKFRDSFLYEWASGRVFKPVRYYVLIAISALTDANLQASTEDLRRKLPVTGSNSWRRPIAQNCAVLNLASWNSLLTNFPVSRVSLGT